MPILVGSTLALAVSLTASWSALDRERGLYPVIVIVSATCYILFATIDGGASAVVAELVPFAAFLALALVGFKRNLWLIVVALVGHGVFDVTHSIIIADKGVPLWWPDFCLSYDIVAALYLTWLLARVPRRIVPDLEAQGL